MVYKMSRYWFRGSMNLSLGICNSGILSLVHPVMKVSLDHSELECTGTAHQHLSTPQEQQVTNVFFQIKKQKMQLDVGNEPTLRLSSVISNYMLFDKYYLECT